MARRRGGIARWFALTLALALVIAACASTASPAPTAPPTTSPTATALSTVLPSTSSPTPSPTPTLAGDVIGGYGFVRPATWVDTAPTENVRPGPIEWLTSVALPSTCATDAGMPDTSCFAGGQLPDGGVVVVFASGATLSINPPTSPLPLIGVSSSACGTLMGKALASRIGSIFITACVRGPVAEAAVRSVVASLRVSTACRASDLAATAGWTGGGGAMLGAVGVINIGAAMCALHGPPKLLQLRAGDTVLDVRYTSIDQPTPDSVATFVLAPGQEADTALIWSNWCPEMIPAVTAVLVTLPDGAGPITAGPAGGGQAIGSTPRCDNASKPSTLLGYAFSLPIP